MTRIMNKEKPESISKIENINMITDSELKEHLEYFSELEHIIIRVLDRDRFVIKTDTGISAEGFKKFGFYVKRVITTRKYDEFNGIEIFFER